MGRTSKPLRLLVTEAIWAWPEIQALHAQGHTVHMLHSGDLSALDTYDLILAPGACLMDDAHRPFLKFSLDAARRRRYPTVPKEADPCIEPM